jgi:hypothetical protein
MKVRGVLGIAALVCLVFFAVGVAQEKEPDWHKLETNLAKAINSRDSDAIKQALTPIVAEGTKRGARIILNFADKIPPSEDLIYWQLVKALAAMTDFDVLDFIAEAVVKMGNALSRDILFAMQSNRCNAAVKFYGKVAKAGAPDLQKMAIEQLWNIEKVECVDELIGALKVVKAPDMKSLILDALKSLTRADCGNSADDWAKWWEVARSQGLSAEEKKEGGKKGEFSGTCVDELDKVRRDKLFGPESRVIKLKVLVIYDYCDPPPPWKGAGDAICFDHIERLTEKMGIETIAILRKEFERPDYKIPEDVDGVCIDCVQIHPHCICPFCSPGAGKKDRLFP